MLLFGNMWLFKWNEWSKKEKISSEQHFSAGCQRKMCRWVQAGRKATATQITMCYSQGWTGKNGHFCIYTLTHTYT